MGAYSDERLFAEMEARDHGARNGDKWRLAAVAASLGVDPEIIDGLNGERNLVDRSTRLRTIAESVTALLSETVDKLEVIGSGSIDEVAGYLINDQLPESSADSKFGYLGSTDVFRFTVTPDGRVMVETEVHGGGMAGPFSFGTSSPLSGDWVGQKIQSYGVEREPEFYEFVASSIKEQLAATGVHHG